MEYIIYIFSSAAVPSPCSANEEHRFCGPPCPLTCDTLYTSVCCDFQCSRGCFCRDGYILVSKVGQRRCVAINDCRKLICSIFKY